MGRDTFCLGPQNDVRELGVEPEPSTGKAGALTLSAISRSGVMCESREKWLNQGCWREGLVESEGGQQGLEIELSLIDR